MRGKEGLRWWFGLAVVGISAGRASDPCQIILEPGNFSTVFMARERRFPVRLAKVFSGSGFFRSPSFLPVSCRRGRESGRRQERSLWAARWGFGRRDLVRPLGYRDEGRPRVFFTEISAMLRIKERRSIYSDLYNADRFRGSEQASKLIGFGSR